MLEITGQLSQIMPIETVGSKGTPKRIFVVHTDDQYNPDVAFVCWGERTDMLNQYQQGQQIRVCFNLSSHAWNGKWFTEATAFQVTLPMSNNVAPQQQMPQSRNMVQQPMQQAPQPYVNSAPVYNNNNAGNQPNSNNKDDLPF